MFQPLACAPDTDHGFGRKGGAGLEQTPTTFPVTEPVELPPPLTLPFDQTSPTRFAAPLVPGLRASDVAVAPMRTMGLTPSACMTVVPTPRVAVAVKVTPAMEWSVEVMVSTVPAGSPNGQVSVAPDVEQVGSVSSRSLRANRLSPA